MHILTVATLVGPAMLLMLACGGTDADATRFIDPGVGDPVVDDGGWLRPGYFVVKPSMLSDLSEAPPEQAAVMRVVDVPGGRGVVMTAAGPTLALLRWSWVLQASSSGLVIHRSGARVLDPPWLVLPAQVRDGMRWEIRDDAGHVLATARAAVSPADHPTLGPVDAIDITLDVPRDRGPETPLPWLDNASTPAWRRLLLAPARPAPCDLVGSVMGTLVPTNPLTPDGGALKWRFIAGRGFWGDAGLLPLPTAAPVRPAAPESRRPLVRRSEFNENAHVVQVGNVWNTTRVDGDPRFEGPRLDISGTGWTSWTDVICKQVLEPATACIASSPGGTGRFGCGDATHFDVTADGLPGVAPTLGGFALEDRVRPYAHPTEGASGDRGWLHGGFVGVFRGLDGEVHGFANARLPGPDGPYAPTLHVADGTITHEAVVATRPEHAVQGLDPDYPAVGHVYMALSNFDPDEMMLDLTGTRVASPAISGIRRVAALHPERAGEPLPFFVDAWPFIGRATMMRDHVPGSRATAHFPDGRLNAWFPEFLSVSRHADGTRTVLAIEYEGAIREIDATGPSLRWRSLGTPRVPDGWWLTGAWREGDEVVLLARSGAATAYPYRTFTRQVDEAVFAMTVREGPWEALPAHLFSGVDVEGEGFVVCAPADTSLDVQSLQLHDAAGPTGHRVVPTDERCALILRDRLSTDIDALVTAGGPVHGPTTAIDFAHPGIGPVRAWGHRRLIEIGGRQRVPVAAWQALTGSVRAGPAGDFESLATPIPMALRHAFPGDLALHRDGGGGMWVAPRKPLCVPTNGACAEVEHVAPDGTSTRTSLGFSWPDDLPADFALGLLAWPASDRGLWMPPFHVAPDGSVFDGGSEVAAGVTTQFDTHVPLEMLSSPSGPRPPPGIDTRVFGGQALAPTPPGVEHPGILPISDIWHGVVRPLVVPDEAMRVFETFGGPVRDVATDIEGVLELHPGGPRMTWTRRAENGLVATVVTATDVFGRTVEVLGASVSRGDMDGLDPRVLPEPSCGCERDTEVCVARACICAPEHVRDGARCEPVLGGSRRPAAGCAAIRAAYGAVPDLAWVDPDGTAPVAAGSASPTVRVRCSSDGLGETVPVDDREGVAVFDVVAGRFEVKQLEVSAPPQLYERRLLVSDVTPPNVPPKPLMALEVQDYTLPSQRLFARFRHERIDLGPLAVRGDGTDLAEHGLVRDAAGRLCVTRRGVELVCRDVPDEPLWVRSGRVVTEGLACLPEGHAYGDDSCSCDVRSCEEAAIVCGGGNDGCFGRVACGDCEAGLRCEAGRCLCEPDADEREPDAADDAYLLRVGVDGAPFAVTAHGFTLDRADDVDWVQLLAGDAAFATPNELRVVVRSSSGARLSLAVGTAGCAVECPVGALFNGDWQGGGTGPGCRAEGVGEVEVVFRVGCDPFTVDAERGLYLARIEGDNEGCVPWSIAVESRAAPVAQ